MCLIQPGGAVDGLLINYLPTFSISQYLSQLTQTNKQQKWNVKCGIKWTLNFYVGNLQQGKKKKKPTGLATLAT